MQESGHPPRHVAIIMDGNGRWAERNHVSTISGHRAGAEVARKITRHAAEIGVKYLTLYTFSSENWLRPKDWVDDLMGLLSYYLKSHLSDLTDNGVRLQVIGDREKFAPEILDLLESCEEKTKNNERITLVMALSYGARDEIVFAAKKLASQVLTHEISLDNISQDLFSQALYTKDIPDPDLLIRTSGELRISNFLLWQMAYTEFVFTPKLWPEFTPQDFDEAIQSFQKRDRRYGALIATK